MNDYEIYQAHQVAQAQAQDILAKQKRKTGVAMLGKPIEELRADPKHSGNVLKFEILAGEALAFAALTSELMTLNLADVIEKMHQYIGRSQYLRFVSSPVVYRNVLEQTKNLKLISELRQSNCLTTLNAKQNSAYI